MSLLLCVALHLYSGPIEAGTAVTEASLTCKATSVATARKAIAKCAKQGADLCEVLLSPDHKRVTLEHKVQVSQ
jgi:hypothetical protein